MRLRYADNLFILDCAFNERHTAKAAGFHFNTTLKAWVTTSLQVAARLRAHADDSAKTTLYSKIISVTPWAGSVPVPADCMAKDFQVRAARFALARNRSYLALRPGLGKTVVACLIANALNQPLVYVCPPALCESVKAHFEKWTGMTVAIYGRDAAALKALILIVPDTLISRPATRADVAAFKARLLFVDEAQRFNNAISQRTRALLGTDGEGGLVSLFTHVVFMSGTPMRNRPRELYPIVSTCAPGEIDFMDFHEYGLRYCGAFEDAHGWNYQGKSNVAELAGRLHARFMLSISKEEALPDLPPKTEDVVVLSEAMPKRLAIMDANILKHHSPEDLMQDLAPNGHVSTYRKNLGMAKLPEALAYIQFCLDCDDEKLVVFAHHIDVVAGLAKGLADFDPIVIKGGDPTKTRQALVNEFQNNPARRVLIGNLEAAGIGYTMTAASRAIMVEFSWVPADNDQAGDRLHRYGARGPVLIEYLVFKNSIDRTVLEVALKKRLTTTLV